MKNHLFWLTFASVLCLGVSAAAQQTVVGYDEIVTPQATTLVLTSSPATATAGAPVIITAQVTGAKQDTAAPTGAVTFLITDSAQNMQSPPPSQLSNGTASVSVTLPAGTFSVTANYAGTSNFGSSSASATVPVANIVSQDPSQDFAFTVATPSATVSQGKALSTMATITAINGFTGQVTLSCSNVPSQMSCAFAPATITADPSGVQSALTVSTVPSTVTVTSASSILFGFFGFFALPFQCGRPTWRRCKRHVLVGMALISLALGGIACGGRPQYLQTDGTPPGTYSILVTAVSGSISHSNTVTVTVKPWGQ